MYHFTVAWCAGGNVEDGYAPVLDVRQMYTQALLAYKNIDWSVNENSCLGQETR